MRQGKGRRRHWLAVPLLALGLAGCDVVGYDEDVDGFYNYSGYLYDSPGYSVNGDIRIDQRSSRQAYADIEWYMLEGSRVILEIADYDVPVDVDSNGRVRFVSRGEMRLSDGGWVDYELEHYGRVSGRTMQGDWELWTDLPSTDRGYFSARR
jgi:hypothetical protein